MKLNYWMVLVNPPEDKKNRQKYLAGKLEMYYKQWITMIIYDEF